jgi:peptidylprolyl isomerase
MAGPGKPQQEGLDKTKLKQILVPAVAVAAVVVLVALVVIVSGAGGQTMSDGSDGTADDPGLKEISKGVKYREVKEGVGEACPPGATVKIHYKGWLTDGTEFDSSRKGEPATFPLDNLIPGWQEGIPGMKAGGIRKLVIAPEKGYGVQGSRPKIPGNSTLIFEVQLVEFTAPAEPSRARRSPAPTDLTKLADGTAPGADDPDLKSIGSSGLKYRDIKEGDGPAALPGATVVVDYIGWLTTGGKPFDSSWNPTRQPMTAPLGRLVKGWQEGIPGMKVGGIRKLVIPPELGYGAGGSPPNIPPNATLVFEIELLGIK